MALPFLTVNILELLLSGSQDLPLWTILNIHIEDFICSATESNFIYIAQP
jgi:hypothetical protein